MKIEGKSRDGNKGLLLMGLLVVLFLLFLSRGFLNSNEDEHSIELRESEYEKITNLDVDKNIIELIKDNSSLIISDASLQVHLVKEFGAFKVIYIYKDKLSKRQKTDHFFLHVRLRESSELFDPDKKINIRNFDFDYYNPLEIKSDGHKYYIFSKSLRTKGEKLLTIRDIKNISTGRYVKGSGRSESNTSRDFSETEPINLYYNNLKTYCIYTSRKSFKKLQNKREGALKNQVLLTEENDLVKGQISDCQGKFSDMEFRLKGDWVDHLVHENKWSFRIIMDNDDTFLGMRKFSFQHPKSRNYLWEWLFHRVIKEEGIIGLRYDFCNLELNVEDKHGAATEKLGIMAIEEAFDKILIENNKMREGVIIAFDESILWNKRENQRRLGVKNAKSGKPFIEQATIKVFNQNKVLSDPKLSKQFAIAKGLLDGLRKKEYSISDIFDIDKLTTFTALSNLFGAKHGLISHNIRIYYNPITNKLEPISFDAYAGAPLEKILHYPFAQEDEEYRKLLLEKLRLFSDERFIKKILLEYTMQLDELILSLNSEFEKHSFDPEILAYNSNLIKNEINPADIIIASFVEKKSNQLLVQVDNVTQHDIRLTGLNHIDGKRLDLGLDSVLIPAYQKQIVEIELNPYFVNAIVSKKNKKGAFRFPKDIQKLTLNHEIVGVGYDRSAPIIPYLSNAVASDNMPSYQNMFKSNVDEFDFTISHSDSIVFKRGKYVINKSLVVPEGTRLYIEPGFELNLLNESSLICFSSVNINGTSSEPIKFYSTDSTGRGLFITNTGEKSKLNYCHFNNLSNPEVRNWALSGAVNFHESDVTISNSVFNNNRCEDYLNIIRSEFTLSNSTINNSMSDAFDGDFVTGQILNCEFINCGNDGIDVSGSQLRLNGIVVDTPSDKAISAGEASFVSGSNIVIRSGEIGVVCKDLSLVELNNIEVVDTRLVAAVFQKKPEYGSGKIYLEHIRFSNNDQDYLIEKGSYMAIDNIAFEANSDDVNAQMYGREYGKSSK
jgi:hypothetical protein